MSKKTKRICRYCKKEFLAWNTNIKAGFGFYCSRDWTEYYKQKLATA